jgi:glycerol-3-phosphate acyltransferase PlsX
MQSYATAVLGVETPTVGLLNIGEEESKGSAFAQECHRLLASEVQGFRGNVEANHILDGDVDVIVTDGFSGNIALKALEGASKIVFSQVKGALTSSLAAKLLVAPLAGRIKALKDRMDPDQFGGAPLLGVKGVVVIGHGSSGVDAIASGIEVAARAVRNELTSAIQSSLTTG